VGNDGRHLGFGDWYMSWLEQCLRDATASVPRKS